MIAPTSKETDTMKTLLLAAAAALCPLAIAFPAGPAIAAEAKEAATTLHDHIRTTLGEIEAAGFDRVTMTLSGFALKPDALSRP